MIPVTKDPVALLDWAKSTDLKTEDQGELHNLLLVADQKIDWLEASARFSDNMQVYNEWLELWRHLLGNFDPGLDYPLRADLRQEVKRPEIQGALF